MPKQRSRDSDGHLSTFQRVCSLLRIFCCPPCPSNIINKLAFHPPSPPTYRTVPITDSPSGDSSQQPRMRMILVENNKEIPVTMTSVNIKHYVCCKRRIAVMHLSLPKPSEFIILHSHVNGADLGGLYDYLVFFRKKLKIEVVSYDYCGYGTSEGSPSESNLFEAGDAVLHYVTETLKRPLEKIILYGQSIGSVPTAYLASKYKVAGVVFHAGLYSGLRLFLRGKREKALSSCIDPFRNVDLLPKIAAPVLFIHGTEDPVIPIEHAYDLHRQCATAVAPLWIPSGGHTGLEMHKDFFKRLREFLTLVKNKQVSPQTAPTKGISSSPKD